MNRDFEYLEDISGAAGKLAATANAFAGINNSLTRMMDAIEGPDGTDAFDASCNTCINFQRRPFDRKLRSISLEGFPGTCKVSGKEVTGFPRGLICGMDCYVNRRTGSGPMTTTNQRLAAEKQARR